MAIQAAELKVVVGADVSEAERGLTQVGQAVEKQAKIIGEKLASVGKVLTVGLTTPIVALGVKSLLSASDVEESANKVSVVFGDAASSVLSFSETASTALGMTKQKALEAAGTFGNLFVATGLTQSTSAELSTQLVQLASDLASFNNMDPTEVLEKLRSGLVGEVEPLRTLGVNLTASAVQAKAMEMGLADANGELSQSALLQARFALIMEQTQTAQGDFARTSDGVANSIRILKAEVGDITVEFGKELLPIVKDDLLPVIKELLEWFKSLSPEMKHTIVVVAGLAAAVGPLLIGLGSLITLFTSLQPVLAAAGTTASVVGGVLSGPLALAIAGVAAGVALLYAGWKANFLGIQDTVKTIFEAIKSIFSAFQKAVSGDWRGFGEDLRKAWDSVWELIRQRLQSGGDAVLSIFRTIIGGIKGLFSIDWGELGHRIISGLVSALRSGIASAVSAARDIALAISETFIGFFGIHSPSKLFEGIGENVVLGLIKGLESQPINVGINNLLRRNIPTAQQTANYYTYNTYNLAYQTSQTSMGVASDIRLLELLRG